jgi:archaemetzincin
MRFIIFLLLFFSCSDKNEHAQKSVFVRKPVVILQPLDSFPSEMLQYLKDTIQKFYPVTLIIAPAKGFPAHIYYKPRNRYRADSTIKWLKQIKPDSARTIVGITNHDVSVNKGAHSDYGVMGLGYKPGKACVVSTFRLRKTATSQKHFRQRLFKVVVHEMGHNFGLNHCADESCIMVDAEGQMKLDKEKDLCNNCKHKLQIN